MNTLHSTAHSRLLSRVFDNLHKNHIVYCILRNGDQLDKLSEEGEIDLLVDAAGCQRLGQLLSHLGFLKLPNLGYSPHHFFVAYDEETDGWLKLDVVTRLTYRPPFDSMATSFAERCLSRRRRCGAAFVLTPEDELVATLVDCVLDKVSLSPDRLARICALRDQVSDHQYMASVLETYCPPEWNWPRLASRIETQDWPGLLAERADIMARLRSQGRVGRWAGDVYNRVLRRLSRATRPRGLAVALLAPDGAGKTTIAREIQQSFYFAARFVYMGLYAKSSARKIGKGIPGLGFVRSLFTQWGRYLVGRYHQARGRLVIFDRYCYDALLPGRRPLSRFQRWRRWLLAHACPGPDLVVLLDAPGEVLYQRKGEHSVAVLEQQRQGYLEMRRDLPQMEIVDATRDRAEVRREIMSLIWRRMTQRPCRGRQTSCRLDGSPEMRPEMRPDHRAPAEAVDAKAGMRADELFQASRRVDWRFLLPQPELGCVAYVGTVHGPLYESLRLFSQQLRVVSRGDVCREQFDVVVATDPSHETLQRAAELVASQGHLYVEGRRRWWFRPAERGGRAPLRCAADYVAAIRALGFSEIEAHWHWPDFESCLEMVPLRDRGALLYALTRRGGGTVARWKSALCRGLLRTGLFARLVPCFSVVARKNGGDAA